MKSPNEFLPLTETTALILSSLTVPLHGYGIMQKVMEATNERILLAPGTLYGALNKLTKDKLIEKIYTGFEESDKKNYILTDLGKEVIDLEISRIEILAKELSSIYLK